MRQTSKIPPLFFVLGQETTSDLPKTRDMDSLHVSEITEYQSLFRKQGYTNNYNV